MNRNLLLAVVALGFVGIDPAPAAAEVPQGCTFETLSAEDKSRYQSRYRRRVRIDGQEVADQWLYEQACMTAAERKALHGAARGDGGEKKCRAVSRPVTSMDGSMTVGIGRKCD